MLHARAGEVAPAALFGLDPAALQRESPADHGHEYITASAIIDRPVARDRLERLLDNLPDGVLRVKGILRLEESPDRRTVAHRVATRRSITTDADWRDGEPGRLVVIALAGTPGLDDPTRLVHPLFA